jgi:hypothetical protein
MALRLSGLRQPVTLLARNGRFVEPDQADLPCPVLLAKIFWFPHALCFQGGCYLQTADELRCENAKACFVMRLFED